MKRLLTVLFLLSVVVAYAQPGKFNVNSYDQTIRSYMVTQKNDTVRGVIKITPQYIMQMAPSFTADNKNQEWNEGTSYSSYNTICYEVENNTKWYSTKFTKIKAPNDAKRIGEETFVCVVVEGPITLFEYNFFDSGTNPPKNTVTTYMLLPSGEVVDMSSMILGFKGKMSGYVKDYPELATKITNKEKGYGLMGINDIVREYNKWYMEKHPEFTIMKK